MEVFRKARSTQARIKIGGVVAPKRQKKIQAWVVGSLCVVALQSFLIQSGLAKPRDELSAFQERSLVQIGAPKVFLGDQNVPNIAVNARNNLAGESSNQSPLEAVELSIPQPGRVVLPKLPIFTTTYAGRLAGQTGAGNLVFFSLDPDLQRFTERLVHEARAPHVAIVAIEPDTGKVLAMAEKSVFGNTTVGFNGLALHTGFPAASLFKLVTAAAALERGGVGPESKIQFRGGTYTLEKWNFFPNPRRDHRFMTMGEALARSCNPVFGRIALNFLDPEGLRRYAGNFGFNEVLPFDSPLPTSYAVIPDDSYELSRTAAGFGEVRMSPVHAAAMMAGIANGGLMPRPAYVEQVLSAQGKVIFQAQARSVHRLMQPATAERLLEMMELTTTVGTSRKAFVYRQQPVLGTIRVAAKTGTLRGDNPKGVNNWFVGAAPVVAPRIAVSVVVVNAETIDTKSSYLGRRVIQNFLGLLDTTPQHTTITPKRSHKVYAKKKSRAKASTAVVKKKKVVKAAVIKRKPSPKKKIRPDVRKN